MSRSCQPKRTSLAIGQKKRMCGNYRPINKKTKADRYPMPTREELFDSLGNDKVFSTLDLR
jgi:hypothetical protein